MRSRLHMGGLILVSGLLLLAAVALLGCTSSTAPVSSASAQTSKQTAVTSAPTTSTDEIDVTVSVSRDVLQIGFLDLWVRLTATAGIEANNARLRDFRVFFDYPSGSLVRFELQVLTWDGYSLGVSYSESAEGLRMHGSRLPEYISYSSSSMSLHALLSTLDLVGMKSLLSRLDISKTPPTGLYTGDDVTGVKMYLADRSDRGIVEIGGQVRAYYYEAGSWVRLDPDTARRIAGNADIVLVLRKVRENPHELYQDDFTSFVIPATSIDGVAETSEHSTAEISGLAVSSPARSRNQ